MPRCANKDCNREINWRAKPNGVRGLCPVCYRNLDTRAQFSPAVNPAVTKDSQGMSAVNVGAEYEADEIEFMKAVDKYKREHGRPFPTCSEVLRVLKSLGYTKEQKGASNNA